MKNIPEAPTSSRQTEVKSKGIKKCIIKMTYIMNSFGWQTVVATPPTVHQGFITVCPPVTEQPASRAQSLKPLII
jgi:hypothetical protein